MSVHAAVIALALVALSFPRQALNSPLGQGALASASANTTVHKRAEYHRFGTYVRTRVWLRRSYWYCPLGSS